VVARNGVPAARIPPEPVASRTRKLTPEQARALEESVARARRGWPLRAARRRGRIGGQAVRILGRRAAGHRAGGRLRGACRAGTDGARRYDRNSGSSLESLRITARMNTRP